MKMVRAMTISEDLFVGGEIRKRYERVRTLSNRENLFVGCEELYYYYYYKMNTTLNLFNKEQTSQLRKFGEQIAEEMGIPPSPLKGRRDN